MLLKAVLDVVSPFRESKNLPEFTQMHPAPLSSGLTPNMMTPSLMTPNLMVTGGAALAGTGRWPPDPSTLTSHPWMSRPGAPPVWLSSSPYGLGPSPLHQTLPPGYPPSLPGSIPPPYQFARDPQSGQLIVIPTEHLPHYGYPYQSITAPYGSFPPLHIPASTAENSEAHRSCSPAPAAPLTPTHHHSRLLNAEIKPQTPEPPKAGSFLKRVPCEEDPQPDLIPEALGSLQLSRSTDKLDEVDGEDSKTAYLPAPPGESQPEVGKEEKNESVIKMEASSNSYQAIKALSPIPAEDEPTPERIKEAELAPLHPSISAVSDNQEMPQMCVSPEQTTACEEEQSDAPSDSFPPSLEESICEPPALNSPFPLISSDDPMGGMLALLTASEMAQVRPRTPPTPTLESQVENPSVASDCSNAGALEMVALEGMALLSQMTQNETELIFQAQGKLSLSTHSF
ncbi:hypothetical protein XENOCAPTIV_028648 [Xenoophorus captivus]|uniref:Uncharacterized protein n=1 Tax=Xenoophorus captivus TaxID=1517983 RepID=A0ABV0QKU9_9TELE